MHIVVLTPQSAGNYQSFPPELDITPLVLLTTTAGPSADPVDALSGAGGIFVASARPDGAYPSTPWRDRHLNLLCRALEMDLPVLATGPGMHLLNRAFGGKAPVPVHGHSPEHRGTSVPSVTHSIYLSPGSKSAAVLGVGGFFKVNSNHHNGITEPRRSPRLLASAYSVEDGVVEGLESPEHSWVLGFQANIERLAESPLVFKNLFLGFLDRAQATQPRGQSVAA